MSRFINVLKTHMIHDAEVLDVCCGNGISIKNKLSYKKITGVDIYQPYLEEYKIRVPNAEVIQQDVASELLTNFSDNSYDIVMCLDGVEHLERDRAILLMENLERIARKRVIIFTPENVVNPNEPTLNHPKNAWNIHGGDEFQIHRSAFPRTYFQPMGWTVQEICRARNAYDGTHYYEMLYTKNL